MPINILMPALSPTMTEGTVAKWLKKEGDKVSSGDVIAEIETDKATMEVEAVDEGKIGKIVVPEGTDNVKVGAPIALLAADGEDASSAAAPAEAPKPAMTEQQPTDSVTEDHVVTSLARTLDQELLALARGASLECPCCGEFVMRLRGVLACPECRSTSVSGRARTSP